MNSVIKKEIGIYFWSITLAFGIVLFEILYLLGLTPIWIFFFEFVWYSTDALIGVIMWYYFKLVRSDIPNTGKPVLTPVPDPNITTEEIPVTDSTDAKVVPE